MSKLPNSKQREYSLSYSLSLLFFLFLAACRGSIYKPKHAIIPFLVIIKMHSVNAMFISLKHGISVATNVCFLVMVCLRIVNMCLYIIE